MRRMIVLLMGGALMVIMGAAPASAQVIIEPGLAITEGGVLIENATACNALAGTAGSEWRVHTSPANLVSAPRNPWPPTWAIPLPHNPFPPTLSPPLPNNPFPPTRADGEVCWLELPGWDAASAELAAGSMNNPFAPALVSVPNNPFPPT
jgi:hypothetical protein